MKKGGLLRSLVYLVGKLICILHLDLLGCIEGVAVDIWPSRVALHHVTHSYPDTLWRRLLSSVPRRSHALSDVQLEFSAAEFCLLTGPSSSGKSTIFRLVQGPDISNEAGSVEIVSGGSPKRFSITSDGVSVEDSPVEFEKNSVKSSACLAMPLLLDEKPVVDPNKSPRQHLLHPVVQESSSEQALLNVLFHLFDATDWMDTKSSELSQSQLYIVKLMEASRESMTTNQHHEVKSTTSDDNSHRNVLVYPAPILLLDEWLDKETSAVIQTVQATLQRVCQATGSVVVCATHVPDRFQRNACRHVQLQSGRVLSDDPSAMIQGQPGEVKR